MAKSPASTASKMLKNCQKIMIDPFNIQALPVIFPFNRSKAAGVSRHIKRGLLPFLRGAEGLFRQRRAQRERSIA